MAAASEDTQTRRLFWWLQTGGWAGYASLSYLQALAHGKPPGYWRLSVGVAIAGFIVTLGVRAVLRRAWGQPLRVFIPVAALCVAVATALVGSAYVGLLLDWCGDECWPSSRLGFLASGTGQFYVVLSWVGFYVGLKYYRQLQQQTRQALAANAMAHQAQLKMLRYQLNPHFLFNTLNAISTLILDRQNGTANQMVQGLSAFLRHSLDSDPMQRVTLKQELDALNLYLGIERIRFADRLQVETRIEPECYSALLPSLLLQPLVENAIKYAIARMVEGGRLRISAWRREDRLVLQVADNGPGMAGPEAAGAGHASGNGNGAGVGLKNTRERLRVLYGDRQSVEVGRAPEGGVQVSLEIPFETGGAPRE
ncbi:sensor histidine kinase [Arenimonas fontis]|uniref:Sensor histidine kinase n=1 Tax=Arenimonas fontis TaxID=2608255 RepID=A0A5B2ZAD0_9GAMM|nr:histidine kinase [Arenimonas fontis]KAA2284164.1 sensor histidine kinase [Arenimonas fontis]